MRGAAVIPLDVDLQDPPEILRDMIAKWREGFEIVYGVRDNRDSDSLPKRLTADLYYRAHNWLSEDKIPEHAGDFRLLDRKVVDVIRAMPERTRFMKGLFAWDGFRQASVPYTREPRRVGTSKFNYWKLWTFALDGITSASTCLRVWSYLAHRRLLALGIRVCDIRTLVSGVQVQATHLVVRCSSSAGCNAVTGHSREYRAQPGREQGGAVVGERKWGRR